MARAIERSTHHSIIVLGEGRRITSELLNERIDWGDRERYSPEPTIRHYTFKELVLHIANGRDETCFGYITGINQNYVSFKKNDITETRALSDTSDITWFDGQPFGEVQHEAT
jgi:hypothetical protein